MDFIKVIRSLEELLYEVVTWLVFYPRTMWHIVARPAAATGYVEEEQREKSGEAYTEAISPPLLLMLTILLAHAIELALHAQRPATSSALGQELWGSDQNLLGLRALLFSLFPLGAAMTLLRRRRLPLDRETLRRPFYSQCYLAAPFTLAISGAGSLSQAPEPGAAPAALGLALLGLLWYLWAETGWFRRQLHAGAARCALIALGSFAKALFWSLALILLVLLMIR